MRLPSTTPQPAAFSAGSMYSALVSASFIELLYSAGECFMQKRFFQCLQRRELLLVDGGEELRFGGEGIELRNDGVLLCQGWPTDLYGVHLVAIQRRIRGSRIQSLHVKAREEVIDKPGIVSFEVLHPECRVVRPEIIFQIEHLSERTLPPNDDPGT